MKRGYAISISLAMLAGACSKGSADDYGAFGASFGDEGAGDGGGGTDGGDDKNEDDGAPASGPVDGGEAGEEGGAPPGSGDCCIGHGAPGCDDAMISECVCAQDAFCCESAWDEVCAGMVNELGCGACQPGGDPAGDTGGAPADDGADPSAGDSGGGDGGVDPSAGESGGEPPPAEEGGGEGGVGVGDCCDSNPSAGCNDATVQDCVCNVDSYCCDTEWDSICVDLVDSEGCGSCGGGGTDPDPTAGGETDGGMEPEPTGDCCTVQETPGCGDAAIEACVCAVDGFCCTTQWDSICVAEVGSESCGDCGGMAGDDGGTEPIPGACCDATATPGCPADPAIEACVCAADPFCCDTEWDSICVGEVTSEACGTC